MCRESSQMEDSVKNHIDMLIFHTAICAGASQIATDGRRELDVLVATPSLRSGMEVNKQIILYICKYTCYTYQDFVKNF